MIEKEPFRKYDLEKKKDDVISLWLNDKEREILENTKKILEQERDSTVIKQLITIGYANLVGDDKTKAILAIVFKNKRNNKRHGIVSFDPLG